jgi:pimeloyl-ACP methyl ester carboxylesterase
MFNRYAIDKTLTANDLRFHYRDWNGHGWPVLLLHGLSSTSHIWDLVAPLILDSARVVALDLRGHGQSDKPASDYTFEEIGSDIHATLGWLGFERPVIVGHSWGAQVGLWLAARHPDRVGGLVMVDGGTIDLGGMSWDTTLERLSPPRISGTHVDDFRAMLVERAPQGLITPAVEAAILANFEIDEENRLQRRLPRAFHLRILRAMWELRPEPLYEKVTCPVLILPCRRREHDDPEMLRSKEQGVALAEQKLADVTVTWLDNTVHDAPLQRPHRLADEINAFIKERI